MEDERAHTAHLAGVTNTERGRRIQERLESLRITDREFHSRSGIDRKTLRRAASGDASVRPNTYRSIEDWLDRLEGEAAGHSVGAEAMGGEADPGSDLIEFELSGNFGVKVVVKGPIRDQVALEESVARLLREMRPDS